MLSLTRPLDEAVHLAQETGITALALPMGDLLETAAQTAVHVNDAPTGRIIDGQLGKQHLLPGTSGVIAMVDFATPVCRLQAGARVVR